MTIDELLKEMIAKEASDLHLTDGAPASIRVDGALHAVNGADLKSQEIQDLVYALLNSEQKGKFEETNELDAAIDFQGIGRFRLNVFKQRGAMGAVIRLIPNTMKSFAELGIPDCIRPLLELPHGLVLVAGPTGSGKTTSLAAMIDFINSNHNGHIMTIEDPIEYTHNHKRCLINQREIGQDTHSFAQALRHILRQDPDVILIGEMRDLETIQAALNIAETGHLVFATLHTNDAVQSLNRIIDAFPEQSQTQVRTQLSFVLEGIFCQRLLAHVCGKGRVLACEIMLPTSAIRNLIREGKIEQIRAAMQTGSQHGMQTMDQSLAALCQENLISYEQAMENAMAPEDLKIMLGHHAPAAPQKEEKKGWFKK